MAGNSSHGSTARGSAADTEAPDLSMSRITLRACKPTPLEVSMAEMMQEPKWLTHTLTYAHVHARIHASTHPPHALIYAHIRARIPVCTDTHANTRYMHAHM